MVYCFARAVKKKVDGNNILNTQLISEKHGQRVQT